MRTIILRFARDESAATDIEKAIIIAFAFAIAAIVQIVGSTLNATLTPIETALQITPELLLKERGAPIWDALDPPCRSGVATSCLRGASFSP